MPNSKHSLAILLIAVLIGFQAGFVFQAEPGSLLDKSDSDTLENTNATIQYEQYDFNVTDDRDGIYNAVFQASKASIVSIATYRQTSEGLRQQATGSGFIYDTDGHVVTNNHVIRDGSVYDIRVNGSVYEADVIGTDPYTDLAVLELQTDEPTPPPLDLGNSDQLNIGQTVLAIGTPFDLELSMTEGIVSQKNRLLPATEGFSIPNVIQHDAAINPGNSGGPLLSLDGTIVGVNTAIDTQTSTFSGVGFAIPSNTVDRVIPTLIEEGEYNHAWIGVEGIDVTPAIADEMDLEEARGFLVANVVDDSPADRAGLQGGDRSSVLRGQNATLGGDVIVAIDDQPISTIDDVLNFLARNTEVGDTVTLTVIRDGDRREIELTLAERPTVN